MTLSAPAIGIILPSSNRVVERVTKSILAEFPGVDACFSRVPYGGHPADGYDLAPFVKAAAMLAQARPEAIVWNATRGAKLGFEPDRELCRLMERETGIHATTTALATLELLRDRGFQRVGLLQQGDAQEGLLLERCFGQQGITITARRDLGISENFEAAMVGDDQIRSLVAELAQEAPDAVLIWSTNLAGHAVSSELTEKLALPVLDSTTIGTWAALSRVLAGRMIPAMQEAQPEAGVAGVA